MKKFILTLLFVSFFYGNDKLLELYRTQGIQSVELYLNQQLTKQSYWEKYLQSKNISNGYYESIETIIKCDINMQNIAIYSTKNNSTQIFRSKVITGAKNGDKRTEGDLKTPLGVYKLTQKKTKLDPFYGPLALVTNYPNIYDRIQGKTGSGIWIHGMPFEGGREPYTKGCIALDNAELIKLSNTIDYAKSILIIDNNNTKVSKKEMALVLSQLFTWKQSWQNNNLEKYLNFYSEEFIKSNGMKIKSFKKYKKRIFGKNETKSILFTNINIIPYPNSFGKKMYQIKYLQDYKAPSYKSKNNKVLYIEIIDNHLQILFES